MKPNSSQQQAIDKIEWPMLIIAWAGSGKTATLTSRIENMIKSWINPSSILAVTFTNKAAREMKERVWSLLGVHYHPSPYKNGWLPMLWTFHSIWIFILKEVTNNTDIFKQIDNLKKDFVIYDESDKLSIIKSILKDSLKLDEKKYPPRSVGSMISNAKNALISVQQYDRYIDNHFKEIVRDVYVEYQKRLKENNALDFDDILVYTLDILKHEENLSIYQERWKFLMIDEYQDTNAPQYEIVKLLASKYRNLAVVWDDWQSIYSWRWADMRNIINFKKDYPEAEVIKLEQNYRSTKNIIHAANELIKNNQNSLKKTLYTDNESWEKITYIDAITDKQESSIIASIIKEKQNFSDNLILYRTNAQSRQIEEALMMEWIPYRVIGGLRFYDRKEIKDMLSYLKYVFNPLDGVSLKRIINTPARKIWPKSIQVLEEYREWFGLSYDQILSNSDEIDDLWAWAKNALKYFYQMIEDFRTKSRQVVVSELIKYILEKSWYDDYLRTDNSKEEYEARIDNINELINLASNYNWMEPFESLTQFLEEVLLITDMDKEDEQETDYVTLMTIHTSKWLEYPRVFITWLEESLFPSFRSMSDPESLEEERRLMYVALTRAKKELFISRARERFQYWNYINNPESRFVSEIPSELIEHYETSFQNPFWNSFSISDTPKSFVVKKKIVENNLDDFQVWTKVSHPKFWNWVIINLNWDLWEIAFSWIWIKKMNIKIAPVKII